MLVDFEALMVCQYIDFKTDAAENLRLVNHPFLNAMSMSQCNKNVAANK